MPEGYLPILVMLVVATGFAAIALGVPSFLGPRRDNPAKNEPYETGMLPYGDARRRFPVQFYVIAVLYILFDVEVILLYPWAIVLNQLRWFALGEMAVFLVVLLVGFVYVWKHDALSGCEVARWDWKNV